MAPFLLGHGVEPSWLPSLCKCCILLPWASLTRVVINRTLRHVGGEPDLQTQPPIYYAFLIRRTFNAVGWSIHISWSKCCLCVYVCVWMLTRVALIITAAHRDFNRPTNEPWSRIKTRSVWPTLRQKQLGVNRHFKPAKSHSVWDASYIFVSLIVIAHWC